MSEESTASPVALRRAMLFIGPIAGTALALALHARGDSPALAITLGCLVWVALWWLFEPVPAAFTALIPMSVLPMAGVITPKQVAEAFGNELILLLMGGFMMAAALERNHAHRRLALGMVRAFGGRSGRHLLWGFVFATGLVSMWISNTAATLMMLPVAMAVLETGTKVNETDADMWNGMGRALLALNRAKDAVEAYKKAKRIDPEKPDVLFGLGMAYAEVPMRKEAEETLNEFLNKAGQSPEHVKKAAQDTIMRMAGPI